MIQRDFVRYQIFLGLYHSFFTYQKSNQWHKLFRIQFLFLLLKDIIQFLYLFIYQKILRIRKLTNKQNIMNMNPKLLYNRLGNSDLFLSCIGFRNGGRQPKSYQDQKELIKKCLEIGINYFETPNTHKYEECEESYGKIFQQLQVPRQKIVIATRVSIDKSKMNEGNKIFEGSIRASLERFQIKNIDVLYVPYANYPSIVQVCAQLHQIIQEELVSHWILSEWPHDFVQQILKICEINNFKKPVGIDQRYNIVCRKRFEQKFSPIIKKNQLGFIAHDTLGRGFLSENRKQTEKEEDLKVKYSIDEIKNKQAIALYRQLLKFSQKMQCSLSNLALSWILSSKCLTCVIIGSTNPQDLEKPQMPAIQPKKKSNKIYKISQRRILKPIRCRKYKKQKDDIAGFVISKISKSLQYRHRF